jgi:predicted TIM-barrel fold metal-dependent hydrolase
LTIDVSKVVAIDFGEGGTPTAEDAAAYWSPKYFPPQLVRYANMQLRHRVLFGSDYPMITPDPLLRDFEQADFKDEARPLILKESAARLLGLR